MTQTPPAPTRTAVSPLDLRKACGQFATGVTVVAVRDGDGVRGMTANSFTSISLDPPLVLVSIDQSNRTHQLLGTDSQFAVSVLAREHQSWSDRFAGRHGDIQHLFDDVPHRLVDGLPLIEGATAALVCRVVAIHPAGDHSIFIGEVEHLEWQPDGEPLLFFGGRYRGLGALDDGAAR
ncbi:MAG: flavin reductase family protein [Chloroflexi bacterium]|nr:flavin reductase family protein [Chloroflexota bacterium]